MTSIQALADFLAGLLTIDRYPPDEQGGIFKVGNRPIERLGLALEPFPEIDSWVKTNQIDILWLHRPWRLPPDALPGDVGILYHHLPFDEHLTMGYNSPLAEVFELKNLETLGVKQSQLPDGTLLPKRPIGMVANAPTMPFATWQERMQAEFGGFDQAVAGQTAPIERIAVVGAMNDALIREAAERGATLYLTGQYRPSANEAVRETGMNVIAVGHRRSEEWGLRALGKILKLYVPRIEIRGWVSALPTGFQPGKNAKIP